MPLRFIAMNISQTGYALPGLVLALGLLTPVLAIDNGLNAVAGWLGHSLPGLILVGSGAAVVIAYVIRFLAVPTGMIKAGFERIPRDYDDSARAAGAGQATTMRLIHLPLLRPAMLGAVIIVFVDCLKELPATLLLRPLNVDTLATSIYQFASRGSFEDGALAALLIVAASIGPVAWLTRFSDMPSGPAESCRPCNAGPISPSRRARRSLATGARTGAAATVLRRAQLRTGLRTIAPSSSDKRSIASACIRRFDDMECGAPLTRSSARRGIRLRSSPSPRRA